MAAKQNKLPKVGPPTDDGHPVAFFDEISDEALEAAASGPGENITFTISINIFYCRFC